MPTPQSTQSPATEGTTRAWLRNPATGEVARVNVAPFQTGGRRIEVDLWLQPGAAVAGAHVHDHLVERFEVLEGAIALKVGHERSVVLAGESFDIPRGTPHTMGPSGGPARVRWEVRPALRTEQFLTEMPEDFSARLAHVQRYAAEIRLAGF